jgi:AraC-like DNA-binding protein
MQTNTGIEVDRMKEATARNQRMIDILDKATKLDHNHQTMIPFLRFFRREEITGDVFCLIEPSVGIVLQGRKKMTVGDEEYPYDPQHFLITSLDLPGTTEVVDGDATNPCLGISMLLDLATLSEICATIPVPANAEEKAEQERGIGIGTLTDDILEPLSRLLNLLDEPEAIPTLAPLLEREILYRLAVSDQSNLIRQFTFMGSKGSRIAQAVDWLRKHYALPLHIETLANQYQMSASAFHQNFRQITGMSPLQYQKKIRLNEARRLMLREKLDAATASYKVGYESPSQFSREYSRMFGVPPKRDIKNQSLQS